MASIILLVFLILCTLAYAIYSYQRNKNTDLELNKDTYSSFRTTCIQTILRAISTAFYVDVQDMVLEQEQTDWNYNWISVTFGDWIVWVMINWNTKTCKLVCMFERDDHKTFTKKMYYHISHNTVNEAKMIKQLGKISARSYKFALPTEEDRVKVIIKDAYTLANQENVSDKELFDIMYSAWSRLPVKDRAEAEDFVRITAFLFRYHLDEMKRKTTELTEKDQ